MKRVQTMQCCEEVLGEVIDLNRQLYINKHNTALQATTMTFNNNILINYKCPNCGKEYVKLMEEK